MSLYGWDSFWKAQRHSFDEVMKVSTHHFARKIEKSLQLGPADEILDYGCGPGFLLDYFSGRKISVTGVDINDFYIDQARKNHPASILIQITSDTTANESILNKYLHGKKFNYIILLSIVQYFQNMSEIEKVIKMLVPYLKKDGKIVLADIVDQNTSAIRDTLAIFFECVSRGKTISFFKFIYYLMFSSYNKFSRKVHLFKLPEGALTQLASNYSLNCQKVNGLTLHPSRTTYILTKKKENSESYGQKSLSDN
jgi:2-polyprenyl-3-methyl-5-hydroxy-6-metoxy-1,4-benzoquinol methylase